MSVWKTGPLEKGKRFINQVQRRLSQINSWFMGVKMNSKQREILLYGIAMIVALIVSFYISPVWGGAVLFWLGLATTAFFLFALLGAVFGHKIDR